MNRFNHQINIISQATREYDFDVLTRFEVTGTHLQKAFSLLKS